MIQLERLFDNLFGDTDFSVAEILAFGTDHLTRVVANPEGGAFTALIVPTTARLADLSNCAGDSSTKLLLRKAAVAAKVQFREELPIEVDKIEAKVRDKFGAKSNSYLTVFGNGKTFYYHNLTDDTLGPRLVALQSVVGGLNQVTLGPEALVLADALVDNWTPLLSAADAAVATKDSTDTQKRAASLALQLQLCTNFHTVAAKFPGKKFMCSVYFRQHLLESAATPPPPAPPADAPTGFTATPGAPGSKAITFSGSFPAGATSLRLYRESTPGAPLELISEWDSPQTENTITFDGNTSGETFAFTLRGANPAGEGPAAGPVQGEIP